MNEPIVEKEPTWWLANVEDRAAESPSFVIPTRALREQLRKDDLVKLVFECAMDDTGCAGERMWVIVTGITKRPEGPLYMGTLRNSPTILADSLKFGASVVFGPEHVVDLEM